MAKRYHHRMKDGMSVGGHYEGPANRLHQESVDGSMIHEDRGAVANLPQEVIMKTYPMNRGYMPDGLDDTIRGIDSQVDKDENKRREHFAPHKY
jgi:hypothetical protein